MSDTECVFCNAEFEEFSIEKYPYWDLQLFRDDQYYLGRTVVVLRNRHIEDPVDLTAAERKELFDTVIPDLQYTLQHTFEPDNYNYTSLGNDCSHLHIHIIPRYQNSVKFDRQTFSDDYWGQTHSEKEESVHLDSDTLLKLKSHLSKHLPAPDN